MEKTTIPVTGHAQLRRRVVLAGAAGAGLLGLGVLGALDLAGAAHAAAGPVQILYGREFPDLQARVTPMSSFLGAPLLLNFWASWCAPCVREMPDLDTLYQRHPHVQVVGLAVDTADNVRRFGEKVQVSYPILVAGHPGIALMRQLGNPRGGLPFTVLFDARGGISQHWLGEVDPERLDTIMAGLGKSTSGQ